MLPVARTALASAILVLVGAIPGRAAFGPTTPGSVDASADRVLAPLAFVRFCMHQPRDCAFVRGSKSESASLDELNTVNRDVNGRIRPRRRPSAEVVGTWTIAPPAGDCNDYAVTKRHELIRRGWSSSDLLLSDVDTSGGEPHLVLTVRTRDGDVVLDNLTNEIRPVGATPYRWVKRQSAENPKIWIRASNDGI